MFRLGIMREMGKWKNSWDSRSKQDANRDEGEWEENLTTPLAEQNTAKQELALWNAVRKHALTHLNQENDLTGQMAGHQAAVGIDVVDQRPGLWAHGYVLHPGSVAKMSWDLLLAALILFSVTMIPYRMGFEVVDPKTRCKNVDGHFTQGESSLGCTMEYLDIMIDIFFCLDMCVNFNTAYLDKNSELVVRRGKIAVYYLKTWFFIDFFSTIPIDRFLAGSDSAGLRSLKMIRVLRLIRLLKLARVLKLKKITQHIEDMDISPAFLGLVGLIVRILFVAHILCCIWQFVGLQERKASGVSWQTAFGVQDIYLSDGWWGEYIASIYWTIATVMSVGYGDVSATSNRERIFSIFTQVIGAGVFGVILVTVSSLADGDPLQFAENSRMFELKSFMRHYKLPRQLRKKIVAYYETVWLVKSSIDEEHMFAELSEPLRIKLSLHAYEDMIETSSLLYRMKEHNANFVAEVMQFILPRNFDVGEVLYREVRQSEGLYILTKGIAEIYYTPKHVTDAGKQAHDSTQECHVVGFISPYKRNDKDGEQGGLVNHFGQGSLGQDYTGVVKTKYGARASGPIDVLLMAQKHLETAFYMYPEVATLVQKQTSKRYASYERVKEALEADALNSPNRPIVHNDDLTDALSVQAIWPIHVGIHLNNHDSTSPQQETHKCKRLTPKQKPNNTAAVAPVEEAKLRGSAKKAADMVPKYMYTLETNESLLQQYVIFPEMLRKIQWDMVVAVFIFYSVIVIPYRISFNDDTKGGWLWLDTLVDIMFALDMVLSFMTAYYSTEERVYVITHSLIAVNYLKSWFWIDFFSTFPIQPFLKLFMDDTGNMRSLKLIRALRLIRLVKLVRLMKLGKLMNSIEEVFESPALLRLAALLFQVCFIAHIIACFWFFVGSSSLDRYGVAWYVNAGLQDPQRRDDKSEQYLASLYWAFTTMTTVGYGDILPTQTAERCYAIFAMILGATVFGYVVGSVAALSGTFNVGETRHKERLEEIKSYLREKKVPKEMKMDIENYYNVFLDHKSAFNEELILQGLPRKLRVAVFMHIHGKAARKLKFFKDKPRHFVVMMVTRMRPQFHGPNDIIYSTGDVGLEMFFMVSGMARIIKSSQDQAKRAHKMKTAGLEGNCVPGTREGMVTPDTKAEFGATKQPDEMIIRISEGDHFGQEAVLSGDLRKDTAISDGYSWLFVLSKREMGRIVEDNIEAADLLQQLLLGDANMEGQTSQQIQTMVLQMSSKHRRIIVREKLRQRAYQIMTANHFLKLNKANMISADEQEKQSAGSAEKTAGAEKPAAASGGAG